MDIRIPHLDVGSGRQVGALTLFPIWSDAPHLHGLSWKRAAAEALFFRKKWDCPVRLFRRTSRRIGTQGSAPGLTEKRSEPFAKGSGGAGACCFP